MKLKTLICINYGISDFINFPPTLEILNCIGNLIQSLDNLPLGIKILFCAHNSIQYLDNLPSTLTQLHCYYNPIKKLNYLPSSILILNIGSTLVEEIEFPSLLEELYGCDIKIINKYSLPKNIKIIQKFDNNSNGFYKNCIQLNLNGSDNFLKL